MTKWLRTFTQNCHAKIYTHLTKHVHSQSDKTYVHMQAVRRSGHATELEVGESAVSPIGTLRTC